MFPIIPVKYSYQKNEILVMNVYNDYKYNVYNKGKIAQSCTMLRYQTYTEGQFGHKGL